MFDIDVIVIEPGGIKTPWGTIAAENLKKTSGSGAYADIANRTADKMAELYTGEKLTDPSVIAKVIAKAVIVKKPKFRYVAGYMAAPALFIRKWFGDRVFDTVTMSMT